MSDGILEALVQLFAVVASVRNAKDMSERRMVVYNFLVSQLNAELAAKYIGKFDDYYRQCVRQGQRSENQYKTISRVTSRVMRITVEMNKELSLYQKYIVLVELYEYLNTGVISYVEQGLVHDVVADKFNINREEFELIRDFILNTQSVSDRIVFSGKDNCEEILEPKHVAWEDLDGEIPFVYLPIVNIFLFKYFGNQHVELNGAEVTSGKTYIMRAGNSIRNGISSPIFYYDMMRQVVANSDIVPITIEARNVVYMFNKNTVGIHSLSFESHSGRLVGIMGVSGSGKSTFANVISGMARPVSGNVYINNIDIYEDPDAVKGIIGFVTQDDILIEDLTVYENLYYNARMSFDNLSIGAINDKIDRLLRLLGLYAVKDVKVGSPLNKKISGGQRKRLNIALELIREPAILILDEPTSGLSSHDSETIIELLKDLAIQGKLIFVVIHQPSSDIFKMFDQLLILDTGGYLIYDGNPVESLSYFRMSLHMLASREVECRRCGNINVEQVLDIISQPVVDEYGNNTQVRKVSPEEWYEKFNWGSIDMFYVGDPEPLPEITFQTPNRIKQTFLYLARDVKSKMANLQYMLLNLFEAPVMALLVSILLRYYDITSDEGYYFYNNENMPVYIIVAVIIAFFIGLTVSAEEIIQDRQTLKRERFLNLSRSSYILSKVIQTMFLSSIQMFLFVIVANTILEIKGLNLEYWIVLTSTAISANMLGLNLSDMMKKTINIYIIIPFMVIPQLILSGVFVKFDKMNPDISSATGVPVYGHFITARWAFEALIVNQFKYNEYEQTFYIYDKAKSKFSFMKDYWVPTMKTYLGRVSKNTADPNYDAEKQQKILDLVYGEIERYAPEYEKLTPPSKDFFKTGLFGTAAYNVVEKYLEEIRLANVSKYNKVDMALDHHKKEFLVEYLDSLKRTYHNKSVEEFVTSPTGMMSEVICEYDGKLWHKTDQVFQDTDKAFSAPLFVPYKRFMDQNVDTLLFNVIVIWMINMVLFLILLDGHLGAWMRK
ncbi:MAG: ATP-binding cassette domain-containing protein [Bacteroidales bacterium]|nr:ATP-binding cassette domain-containing protein [Bacteroidales bacterium]